MLRAENRADNGGSAGMRVSSQTLADMQPSRRNQVVVAIVLFVTMTVSVVAVAWIERAQAPLHGSATTDDALTDPTAVGDATFAPAPQPTRTAAGDAMGAIWTSPAWPGSARPADTRARDATRSSWENPFRPDDWLSEAWSFDEESMYCTPGQSSAAATFRRTYRRLMLELSVETLETGGGFDILLAAPESNSRTVVEFRPDAIIIHEETRERSTEVDRQSFDLGLLLGETSALRLVATGNRILVSWNGRYVLGFDQPVSLTETDLRFTIASAVPLRITRMRIEGE